jgi:hypothetical protein
LTFLLLIAKEEIRLDERSRLFDTNSFSDGIGVIDDSLPPELPRLPPAGE